VHLRLTTLILATPLLLATGGTAAAQQVKPTCTDDSRDCLLTAAKSYLHAIVTHDGSKALLDPYVRRTVQAAEPVVGEDAMRKSMNREPDMLGDRNTRYYIDEAQQTVIFFTLLPTKGVNVDSKRETYDMNGKDATIHLAERIKVERGLITEIEAILYKEIGRVDGTSGWSNGNQLTVP